MTQLLRSLRRWRQRAHEAVVRHLRFPPPGVNPLDAPTRDHATAALLSRVYAGIIDRKRSRENAQRQRLLRARDAGAVPIISVGNYTFGATGKTPCVLFLADLVLQLDPARVPLLLTRGYGDDEWGMFSSRFPMCPIAVGADRVRLGQDAVLRHGDSLSCVLLEDGLQQWRLAKDLEIVMVDAIAPFGNGKLLPLGSLREVPADALARADIVVVHNANTIDDAAIAYLVEGIRRLTDPARNAIIATSEMQLTGLSGVGEDEESPVDRQAIDGKTALIFCGVGNPESVESVVRAMGCWRAVHLEPFADHHAFSHDDVHDVLDQAEALRNGSGGDVIVVTTEKDIARSFDVIRDVLQQRQLSIPFRVLRVGFRLTSQTEGVQAAAVGPHAVARRGRGTKPFLNGQTLVSSGLAQLDSILGGGLLVEDAGEASSLLVDDLHRYFVAEGVVAGHRAVVVSDDAEGFVRHQLPMELSLAQRQVKEQLAAVQLQPKARESDDGSELTIAWQYQKYLAPGNDSAAATAAQRFCHSFDLSRAMHPELLAANAPQCIDVSAISLENAEVSAAYERLLREIERHVSSADATAAPALWTFVRRLRALVAASPVVCTLSGHFGAFPSDFGSSCRHLCDYVFDVKSFVGESDLLPAELAEFQGLLEIRRLARVHALACHSLEAAKFGIKRERRKLKIDKFHLPPEGSRSSGADSRASSKKHDGSGPTAFSSSSSSSSSRPKSSLVSSSLTKRGKTHGKGCGDGLTNSSFDPLDF
ncbi:hypothetical protein ATCC90586_003599 [Pythium insidiosum]|nr:hypothetical protein ATCC90586_003599 [Pythium insidiosum]